MDEEKTVAQTTEEMIDSLGQELMATSVKFMDILRGGGKISDEERERQKDMQAQFKILNNTYADLRKSNRIGSTGNSDFDQKLTDRIRNMKSSIGDIVATVPVLKPDINTPQ